MCYTVPIVASIITTSMWMKKRDGSLWQLNLMLYGAVLFGFIDHLWNGELFLISDNVGKDLLLGIVITACVLGAWALGRVFGRSLASSK